MWRWRLYVYKLHMFDYSTRTVMCSRFWGTVTNMFGLLASIQGQYKVPFQGEGLADFT